MATSQKLNDHFLTCTVCFEIFNNPCTLDCHHTICKHCVVNFAKTQQDALSAKSLPCPLCRKLTKVPDPSKPIDEWADDIKPLFLIQGLLDSFGPNSKDTTNCSYCKEIGKTTAAVAWCSVCDDALCEECVVMHKRIPATRSHDIDDLSADVKVGRRRNHPCKEHPNEFIELHCKDCRKAVCHKCCTIYHRKCESVVTLESELENMKEQLKKSLTKLLSKEQEVKRNTEKLKTNISTLQQNKSYIEAEIKTTSTKMIQAVKQKEAKLLAELSEVTEKHIEDLRARVKTVDIATQVYQQQTELINQALGSDSEVEVFQMYQSCEEDVVDSLGLTELEQAGREVSVSYTVDTKKLMETVTEMQLGTIDVRQKGVFNVEATPVLERTIDVKVTNDKNKPEPTDVVSVDVNGTKVVVIADNRNSNVKSFFNNNDKPSQTHLQLKGKPWSLTHVKHNQVAVTVEHCKQIVIVEVRPELSLFSTLTTRKEYLGITTLSPSTIAVGSESPPSVDILDLSGTLIRTVCQDKTLLISPTYVCTSTKGNIIVSDMGTKSVLCLTPTGDVQFIYKQTGGQLYRPRGVTCTSTGDILVADFMGHSVVHLNQEGQFVKKILMLQDVQFPQGICVDDSGRLYVSLSEGVVKVFSLK